MRAFSFRPESSKVAGMEFKDYYAALGVEPGAGESEIKAAYRRLARKLHPDVSKEPDAEERFKAVNEAYEVLRDKEKRAAYDQLRARGYRPGEEFRPPPGFGDGVDMGDIFGGGNGDFSDFFESLFGRARAGRAQARRGRDLRARLELSLERVFEGGSERIQIDGRTLDVRIPKGIQEGQVIRLGGQGGQGGDLLLEVAYRAHPDFELDGRNVLFYLPLAPWEAALGATLPVPTLGGTVELKIPAGSDGGRKLRLRGRGLPGTPAGDQLVILEVRAPAPQDEAQRASYAALRDAFVGFDPRRG